MDTLKGHTSFKCTNTSTLTEEDDFTYLSRINKVESNDKSNIIFKPTDKKFYMLLGGALRAVKIIECTYNKHDNEYGNAWNCGYIPSYYLAKVAGVAEPCVFEWDDIARLGYISKESYQFGNIRSYNETQTNMGLMREYLLVKEKKTTRELLSRCCTISLFESDYYSINYLRRYDWDGNTCTPVEYSANIILTYNTETKLYTMNYSSAKYRTKEEAIGDNKPVILDFDDEGETEEEKTEYTINVSVKVKANRMADAEKMVQDVLKTIEVKGTK